MVPKSSSASCCCSTAVNAWQNAGGRASDTCPPRRSAAKGGHLARDTWCSDGESPARSLALAVAGDGTGGGHCPVHFGSAIREHVSAAPSGTLAPITGIHSG